MIRDNSKNRNENDEDFVKGDDNEEANEQPGQNIEENIEAVIGK